MVVIGTIRIPEIAPIADASTKAMRPDSEVRMPDQPRAEAVDGCRSQRLAVERPAEEQPEPDDAGDRDREHGEALPVEPQRADREGRVRDRRAALAFGAETPPKTRNARWQPTEAINTTSTEVCANGWNTMR